MNRSVGHPVVAVLLALPLLACGASPTPDADRPAARWEKTRDGFIHIDADRSFRQITRCWTFGDGLRDCVWIGGTGTPEPGRDNFSVERWFTSGALPAVAGPPDDKRLSDAYYQCSLTFDGGRLASVQESLSRGDGTPLLNNDRWLNTRHPRAAWAVEDLLEWSERTGTALASPLVDCEIIGRMVETGGWAALSSGHWTGPLATAADGLATLSP